MNHRTFLRAVSLILTGALSFPVAHGGEGGLVAHEWGVSTSVQGADGRTLDGMRTLQAGLPDFVIRWSRWSPPSFGVARDKPILYLYAEKETAVSVRARLPRGILTEWWPHADEIRPFPGEAARDKSADASAVLERVEGGLLSWSRLRVCPALPAGTSPHEVPAGPYAALRDTDAAWIIGHDTAGAPACERFLLYRGVDGGKTPSAVEVALAEGKILLRNRGQDALGTGLVVGITGGKGLLRTIGMPRPGGEAGIDLFGKEVPVAELAARGRSAMIELLVSAGLYRKEAEGMMGFWTEEWFAREGTRILWLMPRNEIDRDLPLEISPTPAETVRVMASCLEIVTPGMERELSRMVKGLASEDYGTREKAQADLAALGRLAEPMLRQAAKASEDPEVRARAKTLLSELDPRRREPQAAPE